MAIRITHHARPLWQKAGVGGHAFLIGINELGRLEDKFTKEQKQDLMHVAVCRLLSNDGYYRLAGWDDDQWPLWEATTALPKWTGAEQEIIIKKNIIRYFEEHQLI